MHNTGFGTAPEGDDEEDGFEPWELKDYYETFLDQQDYDEER